MAAPLSPTLPLAAPTSTETPRYGPALASLTVLFFMMGFITCLNDILIPYLKGLFTLSYAEVNLVNFCFFGAYLVMGVPAGLAVKHLGYKRGMLIGFLVAALGAFLFYPAAESRTFGLFLGALFVLATGIVTLQVAGNPYVSILGPAETASSRLRRSTRWLRFWPRCWARPSSLPTCPSSTSSRQPRPRPWTWGRCSACTWVLGW